MSVRKRLEKDRYAPVPISALDKEERNFNVKPKAVVEQYIEPSGDFQPQRRSAQLTGGIEQAIPNRVKEQSRNEEMYANYRTDPETIGSYVDQHLHDYSQWYYGSIQEVDSIGWGEDTVSRQNWDLKAAEYTNQEKELRRYMTANRGTLNQEYYSAVMSFLDDQKEYTEGLRGLYDAKHEFLSLFDSRESYDTFLADQAEQERLLTLDTEELQRQIELRENDLDKFETYRDQYVIASNNPGAYSPDNYDQIMSGFDSMKSKYGSPEGLRADIDRLRYEYTIAGRLQNSVLLPREAMDALDFEAMSEYLPGRLPRESDGNAAYIYKLINGKISNPGPMAPKRGNLFPDYKALMPEETAVFNYYYNTGNPEAAMEYLLSLEEILNRRKAEATFADYEGRTGKEILQGFDAGLDRFSSGMRGMKDMMFGGEDYYPVTEAEYLSDMIRNDLGDNGIGLPEWLGGGSLGQMAYDAVSTTANMLPSVLTSAAADIILPGSGKILGNALVFSSSGGNAYIEARRMGFGEDQASGYAALVGSAEAGLGYLLGGVTKLGGKAVNKVLSKILPGVDNALAKIAMSYGGKIIAEGNEEFLQTVLEPVFKKIALNIDAEIDWEEAAYAWFLGALTSVGYGGADVVADFGKLYGIGDPKTVGEALLSYDPASLGKPGKDAAQPAAPKNLEAPQIQPQQKDSAQPQIQPDSRTPHYTTDTWTNDLDGLWTDPGADPNLTTDSGTDMDPDLWRENDSDAEAEIRKNPLRYEDYLRMYLDGDTDFSALKKESVISQEAVPKSKEQIISELAPKISKPGITPGRAAIAAQEMYAEAEKWYGSNADVVLEMFQPGQDPSKFLDGFRNAYLSGKMGSRAALENSTAAAYLTEEQREIAFDLGYKKSGRLQLDYANDNGIIAAGSVLDHFDRKIRLSDISEDLKKVNPNYSSREYKWRNNCQRCVATYEMRRRGYNVTAKPILVDVEKDVVAKNWSKVWTQDPPLLCRSGSGKAQVEAQMKRWGDGARAIVCVTWLVTGSSHVFVAEQQNGTTVFVDPQTGNSDCSKSFARVMNGMTQLLRVDNLTPTDLIKECCENRR